MARRSAREGMVDSAICPEWIQRAELVPRDAAVARIRLAGSPEEPPMGSVVPHARRGTRGVPAGVLSTRIVLALLALRAAIVLMMTVPQTIHQPLSTSKPILGQIAAARTPRAQSALRCLRVWLAIWCARAARPQVSWELGSRNRSR